MDKFLETYNLLGLNHEESENLFRPIMSKEIKSVLRITIHSPPCFSCILLSATNYSSHKMGVSKIQIWLKTSPNISDSVTIKFKYRLESPQYAINAAWKNRERPESTTVSKHSTFSFFHFFLLGFIIYLKINVISEGKFLAISYSIFP